MSKDEFNATAPPQAVTDHTVTPDTLIKAYIPYIDATEALIQSSSKDTLDASQKTSATTFAVSQNAVLDHFKALQPLHQAIHTLTQEATEEKTNDLHDALGNWRVELTHLERLINGTLTLISKKIDQALPKDIQEKLKAGQYLNQDEQESNHGLLSALTHNVNLINAITTMEKGVRHFDEQLNQTLYNLEAEEEEENNNRSPQNASIPTIIPMTEDMNNIQYFHGHISKALNAFNTAMQGDSYDQQILALEELENCCKDFKDVAKSMIQGAPERENDTEQADLKKLKNYMKALSKELTKGAHNRYQSQTNAHQDLLTTALTADDKTVKKALQTCGLARFAYTTVDDVREQIHTLTAPPRSRKNEWLGKLIDEAKRDNTEEPTPS